METSLHRQLKQRYADNSARLEVIVGGYRIDVVAGDRLIEIQHGSLAAIRDKVRDLLRDYHVLLVKPIVARRLLVKRRKKGGRIIERRMSPKRRTIIHLFDELVYFTRVFPHPNLSLEVPLIYAEEWRYPGHGRRRYRRPRDHQVEDQKLVDVLEVYRFRTAMDLARLVPSDLPIPFHTGHMAQAMHVERWFAQRIAYCLREMGAVKAVGKQGNSRMYTFVDEDSAAA